MDGPLADDLFFAVHDPFSGRPRASEGRADACLAAALICELLLDDHVRVAEDGGLLPVARSLPEEPLARAVLARLERQLAAGPWSVADWTADTTPTAEAMVGERLTRSGRGVSVRRRRFGLAGGSTVAATEASVHELAMDRLAAYLRNGVTPQPPDVVLSVLVMLAQPRPDPLTGTPAAREFVLQLVPRLPDGVRAVLARTERVLGGNDLAGSVGTPAPGRSGRSGPGRSGRPDPGLSPRPRDVGRRSAG